MMQHLFVYGTLGPGRPNAHILENIGGTWQNAFVHGTLRDAGWGAEQGYPGIDLRPDGGVVQGFVFSSAHLSQHWPELDEFEGAAYQRVLARVTLAQGQTLDAFIYQLRPE